MIFELIPSTLRMATPLGFAALGGIYSERSGVINLALEGMMLIGAFGYVIGTQGFRFNMDWIACRYRFWG